MKTYKELKLIGDSFDFRMISSSNWILLYSNDAEIHFEYIGSSFSHAEVILSIRENPALLKKEIEVSNIIPLEKKEFCVEEYNQILDSFYQDVIKPYLRKNPDVLVSKFSDGFDSLSYISKKALEKLNLFYQHQDEEHWFDFICQTVDDNQTFDYDTLYLFLQDREYWIEKNVFSQELAKELARDYISSIKVLEYYRNRRKAD